MLVFYFTVRGVDLPEQVYRWNCSLFSQSSIWSMTKMADLLVPSRSSSCENFWCKEYSVKPRYVEEKSPIDYPDLVHSKSDDSILLNGSLTEPEIFHGLSDASLQIQKDTCVAYDNVVPSHRNSRLLSTYFSDSEMNNIAEKCDVEPELSALKVSGCFNDIEGPSRRSSRCLDSSDRVDPEHSIREMIMKNDFYKLVRARISEVAKR